MHGTSFIEPAKKMMMIKNLCVEKVSSSFFILMRKSEDNWKSAIMKIEN